MQVASAIQSLLYGFKLVFFWRTRNLHIRLILLEFAYFNGSSLQKNKRQRQTLDSSSNLIAENISFKMSFFILNILQSFANNVLLLETLYCLKLCIEYLPFNPYLDKFYRNKFCSSNQIISKSHVQRAMIKHIIDYSSVQINVFKLCLCQY